MDTVSAKVVSIISLFFLTLIFALLPIRMSSWTLSGGRYKRSAVSLASCFSGGIFLGVALLHLLPEVREMFEFVLCKKKVKSEYPVTELTVAGGFLIILVFEQLVLLFHLPRPSSECDIANVPPHGCDRQRDCDNCRHVDGQNEQTMFGSENGVMYGSNNVASGEDSSDTQPILSQQYSNSTPSLSNVPTTDNCLQLDDQSRMPQSRTEASPADDPATVRFTPPGSARNDVSCSPSGSVSCRSDSLNGNGSSAMSSVLESNGNHGNVSVSVVDPARQDALQPQLDTNNSTTDKSFGSLVLLAALSLHSLFEGLALGLQGSANSTIQIFIAVLVHKCVLAFALGIRMVKYQSSTKRIVLAALIFAAMSPIGGTIGIAVDSESTDEVDRTLVTACLQGLATGTFLFITFLEVISHEIQGSRSRSEADLQMLRLALIVLGFIIIALVALHHDPKDQRRECTF
eukprot:scpid53315/ scgid18659/ Zinc transporter ZIP3; Solute carrier family 39 member 3; Zrt- and Irt-like protein 3